MPGLIKRINLEEIRDLIHQKLLIINRSPGVSWEKRKRTGQTNFFSLLGEATKILEKVVSFSRSMYNIDMEKETSKQRISAFVAKNGGYVRLALSCLKNNPIVKHPIVLQ